ncbi:MAG: hypothetical protein U9N55_01380 [candidate division Zixibacteria bacterium]|nr:hypothetical protein [candidate division Zixibacteria bacterium]
MRHISDDEMQAYLDQSDFSEKDNLKHHLRTCSWCRNRFRQYQQLYEGLGKDSGYKLPEGFSDSVMARLSIVSSVSSVHRQLNVLWGSLGLIATLCLVWYFIDLESLAVCFTRPFTPLVQVGQVILLQIRDFLSIADGYAVPLVASGLIILGVAVVDRLLLYFRYKQFCL